MEAGMHSYRVSFQEDGMGEHRTVEFDGPSPDFVFHLLSANNAGRSAELWQDEKLLGKLMRTSADVWEFEPAAD